jgi:hypothetical protein
MRQAVAGTGRDPNGLGFVHGVTYLETDPYSEAASTKVAHAERPATLARSSAEAVDMIGGYAAAGVTRVQVGCRWDTPTQFIEALQQFAEEVIRYAGDL